MSLGKIAKVCNVSRTTVYRWVMNGQLQAYMLPSGHYRVRPKDLSRFCVDYGIPNPTQPGSSEEIRPVSVVGQSAPILVADDQPEIRDIMRRAVEMVFPNAPLQEATNGVDTCVAIGAVKPQVLVLDIMMPGMDGFAVLEELLRRPDLDTSKVVLVSGYEPFSRVSELVDRHSQVVAALRKPLRFEDVIEPLRDIAQTLSHTQAG